MVEFRESTPEAIRFIAENMREADRIEVWASNRYTPLEALEMSMRLSKKSVIVYGDGVPLTALGIVLRGFLSKIHQIKNMKKQQTNQKNSLFLQQSCQDLEWSNVQGLQSGRYYKKR